MRPFCVGSPGLGDSRYPLNSYQTQNMENKMYLPQQTACRGASQLTEASSGEHLQHVHEKQTMLVLNDDEQVTPQRHIAQEP